MSKCHFDDNEAKFKFTPVSDGKSFDICDDCLLEFANICNESKEDKEMSIKNTILANCDITVSTANKIASQHEDDPQWDFWQTQEVSHDSECKDNDSMEGQ